MRLLLKIADFLDTSRADEDEEDDEEFEDCDDDGAMEDDDESQPAQVIDMDAQKQQCLAAVQGYLDHILLRTQPIP